MRLTMRWFIIIAMIAAMSINAYGAETTNKELPYLAQRFCWQNAVDRNGTIALEEDAADTYIADLKHQKELSNQIRIVLDAGSAACYAVNEKNQIIFTDNLKRGDNVLELPEIADKLYISTRSQSDKKYRVEIYGIISKAGRAVSDQESVPAVPEKKIAFIGDSITAYEGFTPYGYYWYPYRESGKINYYDTWWYRMSEALDLTVVNTFAGAGLGLDNIESYGKGCRSPYTRIEQITLDGWNASPDIIFIWIGGNDLLGGASAEQISVEYDRLMKHLRMKYPRAEYYMATYYKIDEQDSLKELNRVIKMKAAEYGAKLLDLEKANVIQYRKDTFDGMHPNKNGMNVLSDYIISDIKRGA